jgi:uncharacterized protein YcfJ
MQKRASSFSLATWNISSQRHYTCTGFPRCVRHRTDAVCIAAYPAHIAVCHDEYRVTSGNDYQATHLTTARGGRMNRQNPIQERFMNIIFRNALAVVGFAIAMQAAAQVTFYENEGFEGRSFGTPSQVGNFALYGFNDRASSAVVTRDLWEVCEDAQFRGRCIVLRPGGYPSLASMGLNNRVSSARSVNPNARIEGHRYAPAPVAVQLTFYEREDFSGRTFTTSQSIIDFGRYGFNDRASSVVVLGERSEVCEGAGFQGRCIVLRPGRYPSLAAMGLNDRVSSVRLVSPDARIADNRYAPHPVAAPVAAQLTFYEREDFSGRTFTTSQPINDFGRYGFNDRASSVVVLGERSEVCEGAGFQGRCIVLRPGRYPSLAAMGLNDRVTSMRIVDRNARIDNNRYAPLPASPPVATHVTFYEHGGFQGRSFTANQQIGNFSQYGFNDRASSAVVLGDRWEVCEDAQFRGRCFVLRPGRYPSLAAMGLNDRASSVRPINLNTRIEDHRYAPVPVAAYDNRRRNNEQLYEANVTSVRAVVGPPEQRCWIEREQVVQERSGLNVPGAIVGAIIGGVLGHQIGGGSGQDIATAGGAVAGGVVGANVGRGGQQTQTQDVQRCASVPSQSRPDHWNVTYNFRGQEHRIQTTFVPGPTITVNAQGEPRA